MGKRSRRKRPGRGANAGDAGARTAVAAPPPPPTLANQHQVSMAERQPRTWERGQPQAEADRMMKEFMSIIELLNEDPWNSQRLNALDSFGKIIVEKILVESEPDTFDYDSTQVHIKFLKKICRSKTEPAFYRALAHEISGWIYLAISGGCDVHGEALDHFDKAIAIYESADASEKELIVSLHGDSICIGDYYEHHISYITKSVFGFHNYVKRWNLNASIPAGIQCDCCAESRKDFGEEGLLQCGRCKMAFYCSVACQRKAWREEGHRLDCRKKGEFKVGDLAVVTKSTGGICSGQRVELIASVLDGVGTNDESQSHWLVREKEGDEMVEVAVKNLTQVRSALWQALNAEDLAKFHREASLELGYDRIEADEEGVPLPELLSNNDRKDELDSDSDGEMATRYI